MASRRIIIIICAFVVCVTVAIGMIYMVMERDKQKNKETQRQYADYYRYSVDDGLTVFICQFNEKDIRCVLREGKKETISGTVFAKEGVSFDEMRTIIRNLNVSKEKVELVLVQGFSSYIDPAYIADREKYLQKLKERLFE